MIGGGGSAALTRKGKIILVKEDGHTLIVQGNDGTRSLVSLDKGWKDDVQIVPNPMVEELVILFNFKGPLVSLDVKDNNRITSLCTEEQIGKDKIVWCEWSPISATGHHVYILTAFGSFYIFNAKNGKLETKLKIRSPEDFTLQCTTATSKGDVLWVGLENGDILAISPVLPFPCRVDEILKEEQDIINSQSASDDKTIFQYYSTIRAEQKEGVLRRPPKSSLLATANKPITQGPFLIQPEPVKNSALKSLLSFNYKDVEFLVSTNEEGIVDIFMLQEPVMPCWAPTSSKILALIESIELSNDGGGDGGRSPVKSLHLAPGGLLAVSNTTVSHIKLDWLFDLSIWLRVDEGEGGRVGLHEGELPTFISTIEILFKVSDESSKGIFIIDSIKNDSFLTLLLSNMQLWRILLVPPPEENVKLNLSSLSTLLPPPIESLLLSSHRRIPWEFPKVMIPPLKIPDNFKRCQFPKDMNEDCIEEVLRIVQGWRMQVLTQCALLAEELKRKMRILQGIQSKQKEWALEIIGRADNLLLNLKSNEKSISKVEMGISTIVERTNHCCYPSYDESSKEARNLLERLESLQNSISTLVVGQGDQQQPPQVLTRLCNQTDIIDRIQDHIKDICLSSL